MRKKSRHEAHEPLELPGFEPRTQPYHAVQDYPPIEVVDVRTDSEKIRDRTVAILTAITLTFIVLCILAVIGTGLANWLWF